MKKRISPRNGPFDFNTLTVCVFIFTTPLYNILYVLLYSMTDFFFVRSDGSSAALKEFLSLSLTVAPTMCCTSLDKCIVTCFKAFAISFYQRGSAAPFSSKLGV